MGVFDCSSMHARLSEPDAEGMAICLDCGLAMPGGKLTEAGFDRTVEAIVRQPHTSRCVYVERTWICPPECPTQRQR